MIACSVDWNDCDLKILKRVQDDSANCGTFLKKHRIQSYYNANSVFSIYPSTSVPSTSSGPYAQDERRGGAFYYKQCAALLPLLPFVLSVGPLGPKSKDISALNSHYNTCYKSSTFSTVILNLFQDLKLLAKARGHMEDER
jgi:hypothetical protein